MKKCNKDLQIDKAVKDLWIKALTNNSGYTVIDTDSIETDGYSHIDLIATKGNTKFIIELKGRNFPSTQYGDNTISKHKVEDMKEMMDNDSSITSGFTISVFTDGVSFVNSIYDNNTEFERIVKVTTYFDNQDKKPHKLLKYKPRWKYTQKQLLTD